MKHLKIKQGPKDTSRDPTVHKTKWIMNSKIIIDLDYIQIFLNTFSKSSERNVMTI